MLKLEEIVKRLKDRNLPTVASRTGLSHRIVWQIANGLQKAPKYKNIEALSDYLEENQ
jgi:hypothetical protein